GGARKLWNESFFSAPQLKRDPLGSPALYRMSSAFVLAVDSRAVSLALDAYLQHPDEGGGELARLARLHEVLPLWTDMGGCIALQPSGQLVFFAWDDPEKVQPVGAAGAHDRRMVHAARAVGSRRFPSIAGLAPVRDSGARVCPSCGGSGKLVSVPDNIVCECGGLGWVPSSKPGPLTS